MGDKIESRRRLRIFFGWSFPGTNPSL